MNYIDLLKLAASFDKEHNFRLSDRIFKVVKAQVDDFNLDEDPLGISDIKPSGMKDDPVVSQLRQMVMNGQITEQQFWIMLEKHKPGSFQNMLQNINVVVLEEANEIIPAYELALNRDDNVSTILVEYADYCKFK